MKKKDYKVAKMGLRDSFAEELYLGLGDIFNMVESFEWNFQSCFKSFRDAEDEFETANSFKGKGNSPKVEPPSCKSSLWSY